LIKLTIGKNTLQQKSITTTKQDPRSKIPKSPILIRFVNNWIEKSHTGDHWREYQEATISKIYKSNDKINIKKVNKIISFYKNFLKINGLKNYRSRSPSSSYYYDTYSISSDVNNTFKKLAKLDIESQLTIINAIKPNNYNSIKSNDYFKIKLFVNAAGKL